MTTDAHDVAYTQGSRRVWLTLLQTALHELGRDSAEFSAHRWVIEREDAILMLRRICDDFGDNDWSDDLHLSDILEKHLARYLEPA